MTKYRRGCCNVLVQVIDSESDIESGGKSPRESEPTSKDIESVSAIHFKIKPIAAGQESNSNVETTTAMKEDGTRLNEKNEAKEKWLMQVLEKIDVAVSVL